MGPKTARSIGMIGLSHKQQTTALTASLAELGINVTLGVDSRSASVLNINAPAGAQHGIIVAPVHSVGWGFCFVDASLS